VLFERTAPRAPAWFLLFPSPECFLSPPFQARPVSVGLLGPHLRVSSPRWSPLHAWRLTIVTFTFREGRVCLFPSPLQFSAVLLFPFFLSLRTAIDRSLRSEIAFFLVPPARRLPLCLGRYRHRHAIFLFPSSPFRFCPSTVRRCKDALFTDSR